MKYSIKGIDKLLVQLADMSNALVFDEEAKKALEKGADVVADITRQELISMKVDDRPFVNVEKEGKRTSIRTIQKNALIRGFGLTPIQYTDKKNAMNKKTGVNKDVNKFNQPNVVIARRLERGTSYMDKNPVFSRASRKARNQCIKAMGDSITNSINKMWNR